MGAPIGGQVVYEAPVLGDSSADDSDVLELSDSEVLEVDDGDRDAIVDTQSDQDVLPVDDFYDEKEATSIESGEAVEHNRTEVTPIERTAAVQVVAGPWFLRSTKGFLSAAALIIAIAGAIAVFLFQNLREDRRTQPVASAVVDTKRIPTTGKATAIPTPATSADELANADKTAAVATQKTEQDDPDKKQTSKTSDVGSQSSQKKGPSKKTAAQTTKTSADKGQEKSGTDAVTTRTEAKGMAKQDPKPVAKPKPDPKSVAAPKLEPKPVVKPKPEPKPVVKPKPEPKPL